MFLYYFIINFSILPESPRWLVSRQRYDDAGLLLHHIAEKNKTHFNPETYKRFVSEDKKVSAKIRPMYLIWTLSSSIL